jgi:hypothetical protein
MTDEEKQSKKTLFRLIPLETPATARTDFTDAEDILYQYPRLKRVCSELAKAQIKSRDKGTKQAIEYFIHPSVLPQFCFKNTRAAPGAKSTKSPKTPKTPTEEEDPIPLHGTSTGTCIQHALEKKFNGNVVKLEASISQYISSTK